MIYENEELRLRTININAEVERGTFKRAQIPHYLSLKSQEIKVSLCVNLQFLSLHSGQSDIKRLKKENELLRREIWTLRDECDRLGKKVKTKFLARETAPCGPSGSSQCNCRRTTTNMTAGGKDGDYSTGHHPNSNLQVKTT